MDIPLDWYPQVLKFTLENFSLVMLIIAALFMLFHRLVTRGRVPESEIVYRWLAVFVLAFTGFYDAVLYIFFPGIPAGVMGWPVSPFEFYVGLASLAFALISLCSFQATYGFRFATVTFAVVWLWGAAFSHLNVMLLHRNFSLDLINSWFWLELVIPLVLMVCIRKLSVVS